MEDKYIKLSDAKNALADYIAEQTVSKYGSLEACIEARFWAEGAMNELDYVPAADVVPKSEYDEVLSNWQKIHDSYTADCIDHYNKGRQEVAREIFEEIEDALLNNHCLDEWSDYPTPHYYEYLKDDIAELKKKYVESEKC